MNKLTLGLLSISVALSISCKKKTINNETEKNPATINLMLETTVDNHAVSMNKEYFSEKDTFSITELKYFLSNFTFVDTVTGERKKIKSSYVLFNLETGATKNTPFTLDDEFSFNQVEVSFGVDSIANTDFYNTSGDLQPGGQDGMAWSWNTGYKFIKFEGSTKSEDFIQHIGTNINYTTIKLPVTGSIKKEETYTLHLKADILALLNGQHKVDLNVKSGHSGHSKKNPIASNSQTAFLKIHHFSGGTISLNTKHEHH